MKDIGPLIGSISRDLRHHLAAWGLSPAAELSLLSHSENTTFLAHDRTCGRRLVLRVHRIGYHSLPEICSELHWIRALIEAGIVDTPAPVPTRDDALITSLPLAGETRHVVAFEEMSGREPDTSGSLVAWYAKLGAINARLHRHARSWARPAGFVRKAWDFDAMLGCRPLWGDWRAAPGLDSPGTLLLERVASTLAARLQAFGMGPERFGLVHADMRLANLLVDGGRLGVIDFDDCGFSWFFYDFAAAVSFIEHEPMLPDLQAAWTAGYRSVAPAPAEDEAMLPTFVMLRRLLLTAWIASHGETQTAQALGAPYTRGTVELGARFLQTV